MPEVDDDIDAALTAMIDDIDRDRRLFSCYGEHIRAFAVTTRSLNTKVDNGFTALDRRFDAVDERFAAVDQRFDTVDERFAAVDQRFDAVDQRLDNLETTMGLVRDDVRKLDGTVQTLIKHMIRDELKVDAVTDES